MSILTMNKVILTPELKSLLLFTATDEQIKAINNKQFKQEAKRWFNTWLNVGFKMKGELKRSYETDNVDIEFTDELVYRVLDCFDAVLSQDMHELTNLCEYIKNYNK